MATSIRYAVARIQVSNGLVDWWQENRSLFDQAWETRRLSTRKSEALATLWEQRDRDRSGRFRFVLFRVKRTSPFNIELNRDQSAAPTREVLA